MKNLDFFVRQTAKATLTDERIVESVMKAHWKYASMNASLYKEVEVAEIGIFYPASKKVLTRLRQLEEKINYITEHHHNTARSQKVLEDAKQTYTELKNNTNELTSRYLEKQKGYIGRTI